MLVLQYDLRLPRDYDVARIRHRVATRGHALDDREGLGLKAYLVRDVARGAPVSSYSPLYLWHDHDAAAHFLWGGGGFAGIVHDFGRPAVATALGGTWRPGPTVGPDASYAVVQHTALGPEDHPEAVAARLDEQVGALADATGVHSAAWFVDPRTWTASTLVLADGPAPTHRPGAEVYEVLHLSTPGLDRLR